jgi:hypothetical protein
VSVDDHIQRCSRGRLAAPTYGWLDAKVLCEGRKITVALVREERQNVVRRCGPEYHWPTTTGGRETTCHERVQRLADFARAMPACLAMA